MTKVQLFLISLIMISLRVFSAEVAPVKDRNFIIVVGNPGSGKSTLLNGLIGKNIFKSGISAGVGLTDFFTTHEQNGFTYVDTPGLEDARHKEKAAREIETALKQNGSYRIFFVVTSESGRVRPADVATINAVMEAVKVPHKQFNVIVNKITPNEKSLFVDPTKQKLIRDCLNSGSEKTESFYYLDFDFTLAQQQSDLVKIPPDFVDFVEKSSLSMEVKDSEVGTISTANLDERTKVLEEEIARLKSLPPVIQYVAVPCNNGGGGDDCVIF